MVLDVSALPDDEDSDEPADELTIDLDQPRRKKKGLGQLHISHLLQMVLQDAQTRLTFKAQSVIQSDIRYYAPKQEDLAYPDILICACCSLQGEEIDFKNVLVYYSCSKANIRDGDQGKRKCEPNIPPAVAGQAVYMVLDFTKNCVGTLAAPRLCQGTLFTCLIEAFTN
jgi:hypothetical protein